MSLESDLRPWRAGDHSRIYKLLSIKIVVSSNRHGRRAHPNSGGIVVQRKRWLARAALLVGAGLLALVLVAATAVASPSTQAKKGGTFVVELSTDIDYMDPQLDYLSSGWEIQYAVGCKLFNYPDKAGDPGSQLQPEAATGPPRRSCSLPPRPSSTSSPARTPLSPAGRAPSRES